MARVADGERDEQTGEDPAERNDLAIFPYFPLASGMLTGKYRRGEEPATGTRLAGMPAERRERALSDRAFDVVEALETFATSKGRTLLELAMSWLAGLPAMGSVIAGATSPEQVRANVKSRSVPLPGAYEPDPRGPEGPAAEASLAEALPAEAPLAEAAVTETLPLASPAEDAALHPPAPTP